MTTATMPITTLTFARTQRVPSPPVFPRTGASERPPGHTAPDRRAPVNDVHAAWTAGVALLRPWGRS
jgi:hypothetical protein